MSEMWSEDLLATLTVHRWDQRARSCACGWTQRRSLPRGQEQVNHPRHQVEMCGHGAAPGRST